MVKLFVGGIPHDMSEHQLAVMIAPHGDIETMEIVRDSTTGIGKGYAFIEMQESGAANEVIDRLNGISIGERHLIIQIVDEQKKYVKTQKIRYDAAPEKDLLAEEKKKRKGPEGVVTRNDN